VLGEAVEGAAGRFGDRPAICTASRVLTWGDLHLAADLLAPVLAARGVRPGTVVALVLRSGPEWAAAAVAVDRAGGTIAGVSPVASPAERAAMVEVVDPLLVLAEPDLVDGLSLRRDVAVLSPDGLLDGVAPGDLGAPPVPAHDRGDARGFAVCFTSGTTGAPKAALFTVAQARAVEHIDLGAGFASIGDGGAPMIASTQFAHVGFVLKFAWYARIGMTLHVMDRWRADDALELLAAHRMPTLGVVAPQLALMLRSPRMDALDLSALRLVIAGGAASPPALVTEACRRLGIDYSIRWSSTESGGVGLAALIDGGDTDALGTIGRPRAGIEARVAADGGGIAATDEVGELQVRSAATMTGYLGDPAATEAARTDDGWLRTGDLARRRDDGRFVLCGRGTDMYIRGGYNVHPEEVEAVLGSHPAVAAVAIAPRSDDVMGEIGVAVVVPADLGNPPTLEELREHGGRVLARHKLPEAITLVGKLPITSAAKLDRRRLGGLDGVTGK